MTRNEIIEHHLKDARRITDRLTLGANRTGSAWQDAYQVACLALVEASVKFDRSRGTPFLAYALPAMEHAIANMRMREAKRWDVEIVSRHCEEADGRDSAAERDEYEARMVQNPEELLIERDERVLGQHRLSRLSPRRREVVDALLHGDPVPSGGRGLSAARVAKEIGLRIPATARPRKTAMTGAERFRRYYQRMPLEKRQAREAARRERDAAKRAAAAEARAAL